MTVPHQSQPDVDPSETPEIRAMLEAVGVRETTDVIRAGGLPSLPASARNSMFIRGASQGGSPFLNFLTRLTGVAAALAILGIVALLVMVGRSVVRGAKQAVPSEVVAAPPAADGSVACAVATLPDDELIPAIAQVPQVALGTVRLPRGSALQRVPGATSRRRGADVVDMFQTGPASMAVWYAGSSSKVRSVLVTFSQPRPLCRALQTSGLLQADARVRVGATNVVEVLEGTPAPFFATGSVVVAGDSSGVVKVQLVPR